MATASAPPEGDVMRRTLSTICVLFATLLLSPISVGAEDYRYPYRDPYLATATSAILNADRVSPRLLRQVVHVPGLPGRSRLPGLEGRDSLSGRSVSPESSRAAGLHSLWHRNEPLLRPGDVLRQSVPSCRFSRRHSAFPDELELCLGEQPDRRTRLRPGRCPRSVRRDANDPFAAQISIRHEN